MSNKLRMLVVLVVAFALGFGFSAVWDKAEAQTIECAEAYRCDEPRDFARHFRKDRLHNSFRLTFPDRNERQINRWYANHPRAADRHTAGSWYDGRFPRTICVLLPGDWTADNCLWVEASQAERRAELEAARRQARRDLARMREETGRVVMKCGGAAAIGYGFTWASNGDGVPYKRVRKGLWGAGAGATGCLYQELGSAKGWW